MAPPPEVGRVAGAGGQPAFSFLPSRSGSRPPAPGPQPRLKAPHCARSAWAGSAEQRRGPPAAAQVARGAGPGTQEAPGQEGPNLFLVLAPGLLRQHRILTTPLFFQGESCPVCWFPPPWVSRCLQYLSIRFSSPCLLEPSPRCHWVPLHSLGTLRNKSAAADSPGEETERLWRGAWKRRPGAFAETGARGVCLPPRQSGWDASLGVRWFVLSPLGMPTPCAAWA